MLRYVRASMEDEGKVREFLGQFVEDYLSHQVQKYMAQRQGGLYLALDDDQIMGTAVITLPKRHEAYLGGMRIAPPRQGQGLGEAFAKFQVEEARRLGAHVARALIHQDNQTSLHILEQTLGFQVGEGWMVGTLAGFEAPEEPPLSAGPAWAVDRDRVLAFYQRFSDDLWAEGDHWAPHSLSMEDLWNRFEASGLALAPQDPSEEIDTVAMYRIGQNETMHLHYFRSVDGKLAEELLRYLWIEARAWGISKLHFGLTQKQAERLVAAAAIKPTDTWSGLILEKDLTLIPHGSDEKESQTVS